MPTQKVTRQLATCCIEHTVNNEQLEYIEDGLALF